MPASPLAADPDFVDRSYAPNAPTSGFLFYFVSLFLFPIDHGNPSDSQSGSPVAFFMNNVTLGLLFCLLLLVQFKGCKL